MKKQIAVIGLGRFGTSIAKTLHAAGADIIAIDQDRDSVEDIQEYSTLSYIADSTEEKALKKIGVQDVDVAIVAIGSDIQSSILTAMSLIELGVPIVIAKALDAKHGKALHKLGVTKVVYPERDMGIRVANSILPSNIIDMFELSEDYSIVEMHVPKSMIGNSLIELNIRAKYNINVLAYKRNQIVYGNPNPSVTFEEGDILVVMGDNQSLNEFESLK